MKKGFTIIEVSILFIIFLIVAFLVAPLSLDDTMQAKNISRWRVVQQDFTNIFYSIEAKKEESPISFKLAIESAIENEVKNNAESYKISSLNGTILDELYRFNNFKNTYSNAIIALKLFDKPKENLLGVLMYDVNGPMGPNTWGKDVFGLNIYERGFIPFGAELPFENQRRDCSKNGTGISCSNFYLIGGNFD